jgi:hypothetical protein
MPECLHESWECKGYNPVFPDWGSWHECNDCYFNWAVDSDFGKNQQIGLCSVCQVPGGTGYITKDSGKREEYDSGMVRDTQEGKPRYDLLVPDGVPYEHQFLTRVAGLLARGAEKYSDRNWEKASGSAELARFKSSALRHLMQWITDERDEDHAAAVVFNLLAYESIKWKMENGDS